MPASATMIQKTHVPTLHRTTASQAVLTSLAYTSGVAAIRLRALMRCEPNPNFGFRSDRSSKDRLELGEAAFADSYRWRDALEQP